MLVDEGSGSGSVQNNETDSDPGGPKNIRILNTTKKFKFVVHHSLTVLIYETVLQSFYVTFYIQPSFNRGSGVDPDLDEMKSQKYVNLKISRILDLSN